MSDVGMKWEEGKFGVCIRDSRALDVRWNNGVLEKAIHEWNEADSYPSIVWVPVESISDER